MPDVPQVVALVEAQPEDLIPPADPWELDAWLLAHELRISEWYADRFAALVTDALRAFASTVTAAGDIAALDPFQVLTFELNGDLADRVGELYLAGGIGAWNASGVAATLPLEDQDLWAMDLNDEVRAYLPLVTNRIVGASSTVWADIKVGVYDATTQWHGMTGVQLAKHIQDVAGYSRARAKVIARTEIVGAFNGGTMHGARALGVNAPHFKQWLATKDSRTRDSHRAADGQVVPFDDEFSVGDAYIDHPGDPNGPANEVIQCRCTVLLYYSGDKLPDGRYVDEAAAGVEAPPEQVESELREPPFSPQEGNRTGNTLFTRAEDGEVVVEWPWKDTVSDGDVRISLNADTINMIAASGGFKNTLETGTTAGDPFADREAHERAMFGAGSNPIYGFVAPSFYGGADNRDAVFDYGDVVARLRSTVGKRTSITIGDSLYTEDPPAPMPMTGVRQRDVFRVGEAISGEAPPDEIRSSSLYYVEAQVHGGVRLTDIEAFDVPDRPARPGEVKWAVKNGFLPEGTDPAGMRYVDIISPDTKRLLKEAGVDIRLTEPYEPVLFRGEGL